MIVVVVPEPMPWEAELRRTLPDDTVVFSPGVVHLASRAKDALWSRARTDRRMWTRFARRRVVDVLAARWLPREARVVYAPSLGAERTFAVARQRGVETVLIHDLPCMRELHEDLDLAARRYPDCVFLRRFRAPRAVLAQQEVERVLADRVMARAGYASELLRARGVTEERLVPLSERPHPGVHASAPARTGRGGGSATMLLAGFAAARSGSNEALQALERRPHVTLLVRAGEGVEPRRLLAHRQVRIATIAERQELSGVDAVLAPSWCESHPMEVARAFAGGVPVIGTRRAMGGRTPARAVEPGDAQGLGLAIDAVLGEREAMAPG